MEIEELINRLNEGVLDVSGGRYFIRLIPHQESWRMIASEIGINKSWKEYDFTTYPEKPKIPLHLCFCPEFYDSKLLYRFRDEILDVLKRRLDDEYSNKLHII